MKEVNIHEAKTQFSKLVQRVEAGESIIIARAGVPVARLTPIVSVQFPRRLGCDAGVVVMADDFDAPLPADVMAGFLGEDHTNQGQEPDKR